MARIEVYRLRGGLLAFLPDDSSTRDANVAIAVRYLHGRPNTRIEDRSGENLQALVVELETSYRIAVFKSGPSAH